MGPGITEEWSIPDLCNRRVLCQHWQPSMHPQCPRRSIRSSSGCAQHHCRSVTPLGLPWAGRWFCCSDRRQLRGHCRTAAAGTNPQPCLVLQRASGGRESKKPTATCPQLSLTTQREDLHHISLKSHFYYHARLVFKVHFTLD